MTATATMGPEWAPTVEEFTEFLDSEAEVDEGLDAMRVALKNENGFVEFFDREAEAQFMQICMFMREPDRIWKMHRHVLNGLWYLVGTRR